MLPAYCIGDVLTCIVCVKVIDPFGGFYNCEPCKTAHHLLCAKTKVAAKKTRAKESKGEQFLRAVKAWNDKEAAELSSHSEEEHDNQRCVMNHFM